MQDRLLQFFEYEHYHEDVQPIAKGFRDFAHRIVAAIPSNPERTVALRELLLARDATLRAKAYKEPAGDG